jgi:DNA helicase-2/ATP-dependent DNA helicase PcrA
MLRHPDIHAAYAGFFDFIAEFDLMKRDAKGTYEWSDVFPLIYLKIMLDGAPADHSVKHLVIDEMQDYSAIQYKVLSQIYPCRKTILGDANQSVSPLSSSDSDIITEIVPQSRAVALYKSYRSTVQITRFSLQVRPNPDIIPIERHGEEPAIHACAEEAEQTALIKQWLHEFFDSDRQSLGIICKTQQQAAALHRKLKSYHDKIHLLDAKSTNFDAGVILATAHLVKGLEFDEVIIPSVDANNYRTSIDRQMLYVACTRAMHHLRLTHTGEASRFLSKNYSNI